MDSLTCANLNGPFVIFNIMVNLFYAFCMVCHGERIKQPLKLLLSAVIVCTLIFLISALLLLFVHVTKESSRFLLATYVVFAWSLSTRMTSCVWLNFFYYTQIVPSQTDLFIWIKRNIKPFMYCIWLAEWIISLLDVGVMVFHHLKLTNLNYINWSSNSTIPPAPVFILSTSMSNVYNIVCYFTQGHFIFSLSVMMISSGSTVVYLCTHMHQMGENILFSPKLRSQVRVTATGILQGVLYFLCSAMTMYKTFYDRFSKESLNPYIHFTLLNFYMIGSSLALGAGQSLFRRRVEGMWLRAAQCCKSKLNSDRKTNTAEVD